MDNLQAIELMLILKDVLESHRSVLIQLVSEKVASDNVKVVDPGVVVQVDGGDLV